MEGTEAAYATASGMAAISATLLSLCNAGDVIVSSHSVYGGTFALMKDFLPAKCNIRTVFVDLGDAAAVEAAVARHRPKVLYAETLANPTLAVADLPSLSAVAKRHGATFVVDNTFTPMAVTPARWGADVVVHSLTKGISGSSDCLGGAICGSAAFIAGLFDFHTGSVFVTGPTMDVKVAAELSLRIPHLGLRVREQARRAEMYAKRLEAAGANVVYPGLPSHPQHELFAKLSNSKGGYGCGGLFTIDCGTLPAASRLMERLQNREGWGLIAVSLGYHETLLSASGSSTSSELSPEERARAGVTDGLLRVSVGITGGAEQRWDQLGRAWRAHAAAEAARARGVAPPFRAARLEAAPMAVSGRRAVSVPASVAVAKRNAAAAAVAAGGGANGGAAADADDDAVAAAVARDLSESADRLGEMGLTRAASWDSFGDELEGDRDDGDFGDAAPLGAASINKKTAPLAAAVANAVTDEANVAAMLSSSPASAAAFETVAAKGQALAREVGGTVKLIQGKRVLYVRANGGGGGAGASK